MRKLILILLSCSMVACATTETPQSMAAKTLLLTRQTVIAAARTTDELCKLGTVKQPECIQAKTAYEHFQVCYEPTSTAFLMAIQNGAGDYNKLANDALACQQAFGGTK